MLGKIEMQKRVKVIKKDEKAPEPRMSDDMRRAALSFLSLLEREFPVDYHKLLRKVKESSA